MIRLTKLDKTQLLVNVESIKYIEKTPDSLIFFNNGDRLIVAETLDEIETSMVELQRRILHTASPDQ